MQVTQVNKQNFGATPCKITKRLLFELEKNSFDTTNILRMMKVVYADQFIKTGYLQDGTLCMNFFTKDGVKTLPIIKESDALKVNIDNLTLLEPRRFFRKLYDGLNHHERRRTPEQKIWDKINGVHPDR